MDDIREFQGQYRWLSNFWEAEIDFSDFRYPTVEHAYQASKTLDNVWRKRIAMCATAGQAKRMGKKAPLRPDWEVIKVNQMYWLVKKKFYQHPGLGLMLIDTSPRLLVEGNRWHDNFWGQCLCQACRFEIKHNHLGIILMQVRSELIKTQGE